MSSFRATPPPVKFTEAFLYWLKLGLISFGGPTGQIALMHEELVERRRWISEKRFLHALNYCMVLPGPEAQQLATYIGWLMHGTWGGVVAGALFVLPSYFILIALAWIYMSHGDVPAVAAVLYGIKPAVIAIVAFAAYRIGSRVLTNALLWSIAAVALIASYGFNVPFPYIVLGAALAGYLGGRLAPQKFSAAGNAAGDAGHFGAALLDDATPPPPHARFKWSRSLAYGAVGVGIWIAVQGGLLAAFGRDGVLTQISWFFTKASLITFGGAYAVLPYVYQGAVEHYQWLAPAQMIDGLALGETTPGPLLMIVAFVGFVAAWTQQAFGPGQLVWAGVVGAAVATFVTFLPSFLFILVGAPAVEATRGELKFTAPLTGITAAVVGVILNLAIFFAYHVFWSDGFATPLTAGMLLQGFDWMAAAIAIAAFLALWRWQTGVVPVIAGCAVLGLIAAIVR